MRFRPKLSADESAWQQDYAGGGTEERVQRSSCEEESVVDVREEVELDEGLLHVRNDDWKIEGRRSNCKKSAERSEGDFFECGAFKFDQLLYLVGFGVKFQVSKLEGLLLTICASISSPG